jgi:glycosyltransferase involved in cell wall biosynthesis
MPERLKSLRILISAYACEPDKGSEPYVGWSWAKAASKIADEVHVITRANNRESIESALLGRGIKNLFFHYFDLPKLALYIKKRIPFGAQLYYYFWQLCIKKLALRLHRKHNFDLAHHITFAGLLYPPGIVNITAKLIWGPVQFVSAPHSLMKSLSFKAKIAEYFHGIIMAISFYHPDFRKAFKKVEVFIRPPFSRIIPDNANVKIMSICNNFVSFDNYLNNDRNVSLGEVRLVSLSRLIYLKGIDLGLEALSVLKDRGLKFKWIIIGEGPERVKWEKSAIRLGLGDCVEFRGVLSHDQAIKALRDANIFLHPCFREGCSFAVIEGMASGLPVVCLNWGGPGFIVDDSCGIRVDVLSGRDSIIQGLVDAIDKLSVFSVRKIMGEAARERVRQHFSLEALDKIAARVYYTACNPKRVYKNEDNLSS